MAKNIGGGVVQFERLDSGNIVFNGLNQNAEILSRLTSRTDGTINLSIDINANQWSNTNLADTGLYEFIAEIPDNQDVRNFIVQFYTLEASGDNMVVGEAVSLSYTPQTENRSQFKVFSNQNISYRVIFLR